MEVEKLHEKHESCPVKEFGAVAEVFAEDLFPERLFKMSRLQDPRERTSRILLLQSNYYAPRKVKARR